MATIESTTVERNAGEPSMMLMCASWPNCTIGAKIITANGSRLDQRPASSITRYRRVLCRSREAERRWIDTRNQERLISLENGIITETTVRMTPNGQNPCSNRSAMPSMMVCGCGAPSSHISLIGNP